MTQAGLSTTYLDYLHSLAAAAATASNGSSDDDEDDGDPGRRWDVFVYGTLLKGLQNHHLLEPSEEEEVVFLGRARTIDSFQLWDAGGFPFVSTKAPATTTVLGEVYRVGRATLEKLDRLEGYPVRVLAYARGSSFRHHLNVHAPLRTVLHTATGLVRPAAGPREAH